MTKIVTQIRDEIARATRILLMGHRDPDGDSAGSLLALADAIEGKTLYCYSEGRLPARYRFMDPEGRLSDVVDETFRPDLAIALECPSRHRLGAGLKMLPPETRLINIDHHKDNELYGDVNWLDTGAAALGEMIYEMVTAWEVKITPRMATCLYTAILTDTGRFHYQGTSAKTLEISSALLKRGANPREITERIYFGLPFSYLRLMQAALNGMERAAGGKILVLTLLPDDFAAAGAEPQEAEGIIDLTLVPEETRIGILFRQPQDGLVKVSFRSQDSVDVGTLAAEFDGGGHANASGCVVRGTIEEVKARVLKRAEQMVSDGK